MQGNRAKSGRKRDFQLAGRILELTGEVEEARNPRRRYRRQGIFLVRATRERDGRFGKRLSLSYTSSGGLLFGLGDAERIDELVVSWLSRLDEKLSALPVVREIILIEGQNNPAVDLPLPSFPLADDSPDQKHEANDR